MATDFDEWDWQWEYKHRGMLNYENRTHYHALLLKKRGIRMFAERGVAVPSTRCYDHDKNDREDDESEDWSVDGTFTKPKPTAARKQPVIVHVINKGRQIQWGRRGRKGFIYHTEERNDLLDESEESEAESEDPEIYERWPSPVKHKGGRPYEKPFKEISYLKDKYIRSKKIKREEWYKQCCDEYNRQFFKKPFHAPMEKICIINSKKHKSFTKLQRKAVKAKKENMDFEQITAERRHQKEKNDKSEIVPPFIGESFNFDEDFSSKKDNTAMAVNGEEEIGQVHQSELKKPYNERKTTDNGPKDGGALIIKMLRESTRPDTLRTEFRKDYKEALCKPRRFAINISRIVFHHVTLMNRLRLKVIPKLDLTTYLVFTYCRESTLGVDLFRVHVASTWAGSGESMFVHFENVSNGNVTQIQELIQCVVSAIDSVNLRHLVAKENRRNKKNMQTGYRPTSKFPMLYAVMKWEFTNMSVPRDCEWYSIGDVEEKSHTLFDLKGFRQLFESNKSNQISKTIRRGPSDPDICGGCLMGNDINGDIKLMALDACSHWFCEQCWKSRVLRQIKKANLSPEGVVFCAEEGCDNLVDPITLLTLLNVEKIRSIIECKVRSYVGTQAASLALCPNENCRQIFSLVGDYSKTTEMAIPIVCRCSRQFCSMCFKSPHWPALCEHTTRYKEVMVQRKDDILFSKALLDNELPDDLLSGRKCFNCGRFVRLFVFRKTEPNEFGRPVCLQCAKEDNHNNNVSVNNDLNSNQIRTCVTRDRDNRSSDNNITKWYKIASAHRKMRHPEVVKALYEMAKIVADKLVCAVTAEKYVGDAKRAALEWDDSLLDWAEDNYSEFCKFQIDGSIADKGVSSSGKHSLSLSVRSNTRVTSASSNCSANSSMHSANIFASENSIALSKLPATDGDDASKLSVDMTRAACNIVHLKLELHHIAEYVAVLLDYQVTIRGKLVRCLERAEDLCFSLGILLHDPHVHNAARILPNFMRLRVQAKHAIENIYTELSNAGTETRLR